MPCCDDQIAQLGLSIKWNRATLARNKVTERELLQLMINDWVGLTWDTLYAPNCIHKLGETDEGRILVLVGLIDHDNAFKVLTVYEAPKLLKEFFLRCSGEDEQNV